MQSLRNRIRRTLVSSSLPRNRNYAQPREESLATESVSVIVPIHDAPQVTGRCLASLERNAAHSEIILVDDSCEIGETTRIIREFSDRNGWKTCRHETPLGHSAACAAGARLASRPYLCLLNSDTVVTPRGWRALVQAFETTPTIGVAGPSTSASGNEQTLSVAALCRLHWNDSQIFAFAERLTSDPPQPAMQDLPWISGFALFIRRSLWEKLGGFDRNLPDYGNEIELCKRVASLRYRTVWVRNSYIHHLGRQSYATDLGHTTIDSRIAAAYDYIRRKHSGLPASS